MLADKRITGMKNIRSYYSASIQEFLAQDNSAILGNIVSNYQMAQLSDMMEYSWEEEIPVLKEQLKFFSEGRIIFEYVIPRMGKRVDVVFISSNIVFLLEFKVGKNEAGASNQVLDYALDLKNFQKESHDKLLVPIAVVTEAEEQNNIFEIYDDRVAKPLFANRNNLNEVIASVITKSNEKNFNYGDWEKSIYLPTPTIVEAAQSLYAKHSVEDIARSDAGAQNLTTTTKAIEAIIEKSKATGEKSIIFVTGVPGAGKTLVGLNLANSRHDSAQGEHAVFLSGNFPLVAVLQEALARDLIVREKLKGNSLDKKNALRKISAFIQIIHRYRDDFIGNTTPPTERITIFDESQRAWTQTKISSFMARRKHIKNFPCSEPEFLISTMDRLDGWGVIVCLVGGGQEIDSGEAGIQEWFDSLCRRFKHWNIYTSKRINDNNYTWGRSWDEMLHDLNVDYNEDLHLASSMRSFRNEYVSAFIETLLQADILQAQMYYQKLSSQEQKYPIYVTRDLNKAKQWITSHARGSERYGILASSNAARLKPEGIYYAKERTSISPENWFLNGKDDIRYSYFMEVVASEFETQGLELDYAIVAWDADLRIVNDQWKHFAMSTRKTPPGWSPIGSKNNITYLTNSYRVLLTRARQGFVIFIPHGSSSDATRLPQYYDSTYNYLKRIGIKEI